MLGEKLSVLEVTRSAVLLSAETATWATACGSPIATLIASNAAREVLRVAETTR